MLDVVHTPGLWVYSEVFRKCLAVDRVSPSRCIARALSSSRSFDTYLCNATSGEDTPTEGELGHDACGCV